MPVYTEKDLKALDDLMSFDGHGSESAIMAKSDNPAVTARYANTDISQFTQLMNFRNSTVGVAADQKSWERHADAFRSSEQGTLRAEPLPSGANYTAKDISQFDRLHLHSGGGAAFNFADNIESANDTQNDNGQNYAPQDLQAFERLMLFAPDESALATALSPPQWAPPYVQSQVRNMLARPLTMKIIDADKERKQEHSNRQSGKPAIKIVYSSAGGGML